jgi:DNA-binding transcriptional LysR family regulator
MRYNSGVATSDVDLRKLRYFMAVAEHLNFTRAAETLLIAQPVLSRQIRALEHELGARLFDRDTRGTALTPVGEQLKADAGPLLANAAALRRRLATAARGDTGFTIGFMPGLTVTNAVRAFQQRHPHLAVEVLRTSWADQVDVVHDGRVDVSYVRLPIDAAGLDTVHLLDEPRVAILPAEHALARRDSLELVELSGEHLVQDPTAVPEWSITGRAIHGRAHPARTLSPSVEEKLELVAMGRGIAIFPLSTAQFYRRPDVAVVAVSDVEPSHVALAWEAGRQSSLVEQFVELAQQLA